MSQYSEIDKTGMRPKVNQTNIILPITFDYSGGRADKRKSQRLWSIILLIITLIIGIGIITRKNGFFLINFIKGSVFVYCAIFSIRFFILKEGDKRYEEIQIQKNKNKLSSRDIWGIYDISSIFPYVCRFRNGKNGIFVRLNKDVILGKYSQHEFEHYEAISDAYNICGSSKIQMCQIDYMDNIGMDERLDDSFKNLASVDNPDVKDLLIDIFTYQKEQMQERLTTFDVYVFLWKGSDKSAWNTIKNILSCFMEANYRSYQILNENELRELTKTVFNLEDFSVLSASLNVFNNENDYSMGVIPISLVKKDGTSIKLGKTSKEKKEEFIMEAKRQEIRKNNKQKYQVKTDNTNIDLDEEIML